MIYTPLNAIPEGMDQFTFAILPVYALNCLFRAG